MGARSGGGGPQPRRRDRAGQGQRPRRSRPGRGQASDRRRSDEDGNHRRRLVRRHRHPRDVPGQADRPELGRGARSAPDLRPPPRAGRTAPDEGARRQLPGGVCAQAPAVRGEGPARAQAGDRRLAGQHALLRARHRRQLRGQPVRATRQRFSGRHQARDAAGDRHPGERDEQSVSARCRQDLGLAARGVGGVQALLPAAQAAEPAAPHRAGARVGQRA